MTVGQSVTQVILQKPNMLTEGWMDGWIDGWTDALDPVIVLVNKI